MLTNDQFVVYEQKYIDTVYRVAFNYIKIPRGGGGHHAEHISKTSASAEVLPAR